MKSKGISGSWRKGDALQLPYYHTRYGCWETRICRARDLTSEAALTRKRVHSCIFTVQLHVVYK